MNSCAGLPLPDLSMLFICVSISFLYIIKSYFIETNSIVCSFTYLWAYELFMDFTFVNKAAAMNILVMSFCSIHFYFFGGNM
jgi:hypothetical protein